MGILLLNELTALRAQQMRGSPVGILAIESGESKQSPNTKRAYARSATRRMCTSSASTPVPRHLADSARPVDLPGHSRCIAAALLRRGKGRMKLPFYPLALGGGGAGSLDRRTSASAQGDGRLLQRVLERRAPRRDRARRARVPMA